MSLTSDLEVTTGEVNEAQARKNLDRLARTFLGISGADFMRRRAAGELGALRHRPGFTRVMAVATLLD
jgi:hypothetical protein